MKTSHPATKVLALIQLLAGLLLIAYGLWLMHRWGAFRFNVGLTYTHRLLRERYTTEFLYYAGIGVLHLFTSACILVRQSEAPLLAQVVGVITLGLVAREIASNSHLLLPGLGLSAFMLVYIIWFRRQRKEFEG